MIEALGSGLFALSATALAIMIAAALVGGALRGLTGFGAGLVIVPTYAALIGPVLTVPVIQIMDMPGQIPLVLNAWRHIRWRDLSFMVTASAVTTPIGVYVLTRIDPIPLRVAIGLLALTCALILASGWRFPSVARTRRLALCSVGALAGFLSGATALSGPPVILFTLATAGTATQARALIAGYFFIQTIISVAMLALFGLFTPRALGLGLMLLVPYIVGVGLGVKLFPLASQTFYRRFALLLVMAVCLASVIDATWTWLTS